MGTIITSKRVLGQDNFGMNFLKGVRARTIES